MSKPAGQRLSAGAWFMLPAGILLVAGFLVPILIVAAYSLMPERSLAVGNGYQAVCARCAGLYAGGVAGLFLGAWLVVGRRRLAPALFWVGILPTVIDAVLPWIGLPGLPNVPRLLLAVPPPLPAPLAAG